MMEKRISYIMDAITLSLQGNGVAALESNVPEEELIEIELENDELKIDGDVLSVTPTV